MLQCHEYLSTALPLDFYHECVRAYCRYCHSKYPYALPYQFAENYVVKGSIGLEPLNVDKERKNIGRRLISSASTYTTEVIL